MAEASEGAAGVVPGGDNEDAARAKGAEYGQRELCVLPGGFGHGLELDGIGRDARGDEDFEVVGAVAGAGDEDFGGGAVVEESAARRGRSGTPPPRTTRTSAGAGPSSMQRK